MKQKYENLDVEHYQSPVMTTYFNTFLKDCFLSLKQLGTEHEGKKMSKETVAYFERLNNISVINAPIH